MNVEAIQKIICSALCADVEVICQEDNLLYVSTPFTFSDGDSYSIYLQTLETGGFRITDIGGTLMHLSYYNEISKFREGTRGKIFQQILSEMSLEEDNGEFFIDTPADKLGTNIFKFGQAITRLHDITFLNRIRVESTFYDDLREKLWTYVDPKMIHENYFEPNIKNSQNYPIDFYIEGQKQPLYLFGVPSRDKVRLTTIILQHFLAEKLHFRSIVVFQNSEDLPSQDVSRLMGPADGMISSLGDNDALERKLKQAA